MPVTIPWISKLRPAEVTAERNKARSEPLGFLKIVFPLRKNKNALHSIDSLTDISP